MITDKIDEYLNRKKRKKDGSCLREQTDVNSAIFELLNGLDDEYLDDRQIELKEIILSTNMDIPIEDDIVDDIIVPENDLDNDGISDDFGEDGFEDEIVDELATDDDYDEENKPKLPSTKTIGNKDLYGYDENDFEVAEGQKKNKTRKSFITEGKIKKTKKLTKKTK